MHPLIGITTAVQIREDSGAEIHTSFGPNAYAIERAGGLPVLIPSGVDVATLHSIYERMDAIFVPGGGDVNPERYGAERHPLTARIDDARDIAEIAVIRWSVEDDKPLFGVCRGNQAINVALGGTLTQDIPSQVETTLSHDVRPTGVPYPSEGHAVNIEPHTRLAEIIGSTANVPVNTLHHQSVERVAPGLMVTAYAPDGIIEALEMPDKYFVLSVQWHPEIMFEDETMQALFKAFVDAARVYALQRRAAAL